ncbi:MAG: 4-hydroxy-3-methylbut-2-enyl diphosphate reductase [Nanoarchaeota archaeon]
MMLHSHAKINLALDILGRRPDGYHELKLIYQQIALHDEIEVNELPQDEIRLRCSLKELEDEKNLAYRAAALFKDRFSIKKGVAISIVKNIPPGSGLGGGSSDAASVLRGLAFLWKPELAISDLQPLAAELGSDVPFFLHGGICLGTGRGERITEMRPLEPYHVIIVKPDYSISTQQAYAKVSSFNQGDHAMRFAKDQDLALMHNDLEAVAFSLHPELAGIKKALGEHALLTGSGSAVFGLFKGEDEAKRVYAQMKEKYAEVFLTRTINPRITRAKEMGFCFGVKRAIEMIGERDKAEQVAVLGNLVHNPQVVESLRQEGVLFVTDAASVRVKRVYITAHGVPDKVIEGLEKRGLTVVDTTCPLVKKVHAASKTAEAWGRRVIVFGDPDHVEVKGIVGNLRNATVVRSPEEITPELAAGPVTLVSQTTREVAKFEAAARRVKELSPQTEVIDTICFSTKDRQASAISLAADSEVVIVVGGRMSSNTKRLQEICAQRTEAHQVESAQELRSEWLFGRERIGLTAGASTPEEVIRDVELAIRLLW